MAKYEYKVTETSVDTKHYYVESEQELNNEDIHKALSMASACEERQRPIGKIKFVSEDTGAQGRINFEALDVGDDTNIEWEEL